MLGKLRKPSQERVNPDQEPDDLILTAAPTPAPPTPARKPLFRGSRASTAAAAPLSPPHPTTARALKTDVSLIANPKNIRLGLMVGVALVLGVIAISVNHPSTTASADLLTPPAGSPAPGTPLTPASPASAMPPTPLTVASSPPTPTSPPLSPAPSTTSATTGTNTARSANSTTPLGTTTRPPTTTSSHPTGKGSSSQPGATNAPAKAVTPAQAGEAPAEPIIPDVFASATDNSSATGGDPSGSTVPVTQGRSSLALPIPVPVAAPAPTPIRTVPAAPLVQAVPVAPAVPLSLQSLPSSSVPQPTHPTTVPGTVPTAAAVLPAPVQLTPLPAPISASPTRPVTLVPATVPAAPAVTLMAVAQGETPTAMLNTPTGQLMVGIGDPVTLNNTSYTVQTIHATSIQLKSSHDTLTLKE